MPTNKNILVLSTYPITKPQHGGQKRLSAMENELSKAGYNVKHVAVFAKAFYRNFSAEDIPLSFEFEKKITESPFTGDVICGQAILADSQVKNKLKKILLDYNPNIIQVAQMFPYFGLKQLLDELGLQPKIIYDSHNIEFEMKRELLESLGYSSAFVEKSTREIQQVEEDLTKQADLVSAVSQDDLDKLKRLGANNFVLAPNGIYRFSSDVKESLAWREFFNQEGIRKIILFVGSAHPPNWVGFQEMVGKNLGFLKPDSRIVLAGSISEYIQAELSKLHYDLGATTFEKRAIFAGRLSEERLNSLISIPDLILLPITEGGGSNLKTAEAVISGKKVLATEYAFRGFEDFKKLSNIYFANDKETFTQSINELLDKAAESRTAKEVELENKLLWPSRLKEYINRVSAL